MDASITSQRSVDDTRRRIRQRLLQRRRRRRLDANYDNTQPLARVSVYSSTEIGHLPPAPVVITTITGYIHT